jgi:hypothetical protein
MLCPEISRKSLSKAVFAFSTSLIALAIVQPSFAQSKSKKTTPPKPAQEKPVQNKPDQPTKFVPDARAKKNPSVSFLSMEISALQALRQFQFDNDQLEKLIKVGSGEPGKGGTVPVNRRRAAGTASKEVLEKMIAIRKVLLDGENEDDLQKMTEELQALLAKDKASIDDNIEITNAARKEAASVYRMLRVDQLASYIGKIADDIEDPIDQVMSALEQVGSLSDDEWKEQQTEIVDGIAQAVAGLDAAKAKNLTKDLLSLLTRARGIKKADLEKQMPELEEAARKIVGEIDAETVLRNRIQIDLATLLSNQSLTIACRGIMYAEAHKTTSK